MRKNTCRTVGRPRLRRLAVEPLEARRVLSDWGLAGSDPAILQDGAVDLGVVDFVELPGEQPVGGELWYRFEAAYDGFLTVETPGADLDVLIYEYDDFGDPVDLAFDTGRADYAGGVAGGEYFIYVPDVFSPTDLVVCNLVEMSDDGTQVVVRGTAGDDRFEAAYGSPHVVSVNDVVYAADGAESIEFWGWDGIDEATLFGSDGDDVATLGQYDALLTTDTLEMTVRESESIVVDALEGNDYGGLLGGDLDEKYLSLPVDGYGEMYWQDPTDENNFYFNAVYDFEVLDADAGSGYDTAEMEDTAGDDLFSADPDVAIMSGDGFEHTATGFDVVTGRAVNGGNDEASLYDSPGDDTFLATPTEAELYGPDFDILIEGFDTVYAIADLGGDDVAELYDSAGDDTFDATPDDAILVGDGFALAAAGFGTVAAFADAGGVDTASLTDSAGDDQYVARPDEATLTGPGYSRQAVDFDYVHAYALYGGSDTAWFYDSAGNDHFLGRPEFSWIEGPGFFRRAKFFGEVYAYSDNGGDDVAEMRDSPGAEQFTATPSEGTMIGQDFMYHAEGFRYLHGYGVGGGYDTANLTGTAGDDEFKAAADQQVPYAFLTDNQTYFLRAKKMDVVVAYSGGGHDTAAFKDSPGDDVMIARPEWVKFAGPGHYSRVEGFAEATGLGHYHQYNPDTGQYDRDRAYFYDSDGGDAFTGTPELSTLAGPGYEHAAFRFHEVYVDATGGGADTAEIHDSALADLLEAGEVDGHTWARLSSDNASYDFLYDLLAFDGVTAHTGPEDTTPPEPLPLWLTID